MMSGNVRRKQPLLAAPGKHPFQPAPGEGFPRLLGDSPCLDFANSIDDRIGPEPEEYLNSFADLVGWGVHTGVLSEPQAEQLLADGSHRPGEAAAAFARALALREAIYRVFRSVARGERANERDLAVIHASRVAALSHAELASAGGGFELAWLEDDRSLDRVLWPVAQSAVDLLLTGDLARIKQCLGPAEDCGWLFYDVSKNGSRRWCSMEGCGSQAKMRRYRARRPKDAC